MSDSDNETHKTSLDKYEADLEENIEHSQPLDPKTKETHLSTLKAASENYIKKNKRISIRIYGSDLEQIKRIAMREGLPYQTLITSILHKFATGQFYK